MRYFLLIFFNCLLASLAKTPKSSKEGQREGDALASSELLHRGDERSLLDWRSLGPGGECFSLKTGRHLGHCCSWLVLASATKWVVEDEDRAAPALHKELLQIVVTLVKAGLI